MAFNLNQFGKGLLSPNVSTMEPRISELFWFPRAGYVSRERWRDVLKPEDVLVVGEYNRYLDAFLREHKIREEFFGKYKKYLRDRLGKYDLVQPSA